MRHKYLLIAILAALLVLTAACVPSLPEQSQDATLNLANPASAYCVEQGHKTVVRKDENGNEQGFCVFDDGSECEEWTFFRGECGMDQQNALSLNIFEAAGLAKTEKITLLAFNIDSADSDVSKKRLLEISDETEIHDLLKPLDKDLPLVTPMRCPPFYLLQIHLSDGGTQEISLGICGLRGGEPYWHDKALRPPPDFTTAFNQLLQKAGIPAQ